MRGRARRVLAALVVGALAGCLSLALSPTGAAAAPVGTLPSVPPVVALPVLVPPLPVPVPVVPVPVVPVPSVALSNPLAAPFSTVASTLGQLTGPVTGLLAPAPSSPPASPDSTPVRGPVSTPAASSPSSPPRSARPRGPAAPGAPGAIGRQQPSAPPSVARGPAAAAQQAGRSASVRPSAPVVSQIAAAGRRAAVPLILVGVLLAFLTLQGALDRRDGRLTNAPLHADRGLEFGAA